MAAVLLIGALVAACHGAGLRVCLLHRLTGWPCLTCGSTRALAAAAAGDWLGALRLQPLAAAGGPLLAALAGAWTWSLLARRRILFLRLSSGERWALACGALALLAANWAYLVWRGV